jgi:hypothetical protein
LRQPYSDEIGSATQGLSRTLILDTGGTAFPRRTASQRARFEELDGVDHLPPFGDADAIVREIGSPLLSRETIGIITSIAVGWVRSSLSPIVLLGEESAKRRYRVHRLFKRTTRPTCCPGAPVWRARGFQRLLSFSIATSTARSVRSSSAVDQKPSPSARAPGAPRVR